MQNRYAKRSFLKLHHVVFIQEDEIAKLDLLKARSGAGDENSLVIFIMEAIQFKRGHKALYGKRKKIVFNAKAFDKAFLHHLFIKNRERIKKLSVGEGECVGGGFKEVNACLQAEGIDGSEVISFSITEKVSSLDLPCTNTTSRSRAKP